MSTPSIKKNPLHIPEIRSRVCRYVSVADAISCVRVSKDWSMDFASPIWFAVDFKTQKSFEQLDIKITARYGHHIRKVNNLSTDRQLDILLHPNVSNLRCLSITSDIYARLHLLCMDLVRNNNKSLKFLDISFQVKNPRNLSIRMISLDSVIPHSSASQLSSLTLSGVCISRASFTALLRSCPLLRYVDLQSNVALLSGSFIDTFQHSGVDRLVVQFERVFKPDPNSEVVPLGFSLLVHFPKISNLTIYPFQETLIVPMERIIAEARLCCPEVRDIDTWRTPRPHLDGLVAKVFHKLESVSFAYEELSTDVILALLVHKATLLDISATWNWIEFDIERDDTPIEDDHFQSSGMYLQLLQRSCPNLTILKLERHVMDMDIVELDEWACKGLQHLRVRVKDLDTKEKIDRALKLWKEARRSGSKVVQEISDKNEISIEARVARHLLKFDDLEEVWLGTRTVYATFED